MPWVWTGQAAKIAFLYFQETELNADSRIRFVVKLYEFCFEYKILVFIFLKVPKIGIIAHFITVCHVCLKAV